MSQINVNTIKNKSGEGAPNFPNGATVAGVITATTFDGDFDSVSANITVALTAASARISDLTNNRIVYAGNAGELQDNVNFTFDGSNFVAPSAKISDLTNNRVVIAGSSGELEDSSNLTFNGSTLGVGGNITANNGASITGAETTLSSATVSDLTNNRVVIAGVSGSLEDSSNLTFDGSILAVIGAASFSGNVDVNGDLSVGGVLTYEDVTNVDSVGIVTARAGIRVTGDVIEAQAGENKIPSLYANLAALPSASTYHGMFAHVHSEGKGYFAHGGNWMELVNKDTNGVLGFTGALKEQVKITAGKLSDNTTISLEDGMVHYFTTTETTTSTPNIRFSGSVSLDSAMAVGETISVTIVTTAAAAAYSANLNIDGNGVTENWVGGNAPSDGGSSGVDIYTYNIIKTASATFTVIANLTKTS